MTRIDGRFNRYNKVALRAAIALSVRPFAAPAFTPRAAVVGLCAGRAPRRCGPARLKIRGLPASRRFRVGHWSQGFALEKSLSTFAPALLPTSCF